MSNEITVFMEHHLQLYVLHAVKMEVFVHHREFATALEGGLEIIAMKVVYWGTMLVVLVQKCTYFK